MKSLVPVLLTLSIVLPGTVLSGENTPIIAEFSRIHDPAGHIHYWVKCPRKGADCQVLRDKSGQVTEKTLPRAEALAFVKSALAGFPKGAIRHGRVPSSTQSKRAADHPTTSWSVGAERQTAQGGYASIDLNVSPELRRAIGTLESQFEKLFTK